MRTPTVTCTVPNIRAAGRHDERQHTMASVRVPLHAVLLSDHCLAESKQTCYACTQLLTPALTLNAPSCIQNSPVYTHPAKDTAA